MCLSIVVDHPSRLLASGVHAGHEWNVTHNDSGSRCGYVKVEAGHPWHGKGIGDIDACVHGGISFAAPDKECGKGGADTGWWVGFDAMHGGDGPDPLLPQADDYRILGIREDLFTIRTQEYMEDQCRSLCEQAASAQIPNESTA